MSAVVNRSEFFDLDGLSVQCIVEARDVELLRQVQHPWLIAGSD